MQYLTTSELAILVPIGVTTYDNLKLTSYISEAVDQVVHLLPKTMQSHILNQDFDGKPELKQYWNISLKKWVARLVYSNLSILGGANVNVDGVRVSSDAFSSEVDSQRRNDVNQLHTQNTKRYQKWALEEYRDKKYLFDGIAYPPTINMEGFWDSSWAGLTYGHSLDGWGWFNGTTFLGSSLGNSNVGSTWGVSFI